MEGCAERGVGRKRALTACWRCAGLEEQGALVAEAHRREKTRAATVRQGTGLKSAAGGGGGVSLFSGAVAAKSRDGR